MQMYDKHDKMIIMPMRTCMEYFMRHAYVLKRYMKFNDMFAWVRNAKSMYYELWCYDMLIRMHAKNEIMHASQKWESMKWAWTNA